MVVHTIQEPAYHAPVCAPLAASVNKLLKSGHLPVLFTYLPIYVIVKYNPKPSWQSPKKLVG